MKREAETFRLNSEQIAKATNDKHQAVVEQAKKDAYQNYLRKFGGNAACGIRANSLSAESSLGKADSSGKSNEPPEQEFVVACATDAAVTEQWKQWAIANQLPVQ